MRWLTLLLCLALVSCDRGQPVPVSEPPIPTAAMAYAVADIARQVGGNDLQIRWVIEKPAILDQYEPNEVDRQILLGAELLIVSGTIDGWALENKGSVQRERGLIRMNLLPGMTEDGGAAIWLDPNGAEALADELPKLLQSRRPNHRQQYFDAAERWKLSLAKLRSEFDPKIAPAAGMKIGSVSPVFDALLRRYGLVPVPLAEVQPHQMSDLQLLQLKQTASAQAVQWLAVDASLPDSLVQWISSRTGLKVLRLETLGSSSSASPVGTYLDLCRYNLQQLCRLTVE